CALAFACSTASAPAAHVPAVSARSRSGVRHVPSSLPPAVLQLPAEVHDAERPTSGFDPAFAGRTASTPAAHIPAVLVSSRPWVWPELSSYVPTALQLPADGHDSEYGKTWGAEPAFGGKIAAAPGAH